MTQISPLVSANVKWAVVHEVGVNGGKYQTATYFVEGVHPACTVQNVKDALEDAGLFFGDAGIRWGNFHLFPENEWIEGWRQEFTNPKIERIRYDDLIVIGKVDRRITLRLPVGVHVGLAAAARNSNRSLNQIIVDISTEWLENRPNTMTY